MRDVAKNVIFHRVLSDFGVAGPIRGRRIERRCISVLRMYGMFQEKAVGQRGDLMLGIHDWFERRNGGLCFSLFVLPVQFIFSIFQGMISPRHEDQGCEKCREEYLRTDDPNSVPTRYPNPEG